MLVEPATGVILHLKPPEHCWLYERSTDLYRFEYIFGIFDWSIVMRFGLVWGSLLVAP